MTNAIYPISHTKPSGRIPGSGTIYKRDLTFSDWEELGDLESVSKVEMDRKDVIYSQVTHFDYRREKALGIGESLLKEFTLGEDGCVVTQDWLKRSGLGIGDRIWIYWVENPLFEEIARHLY
jgi:hypothetical protein